MDSPLYHGIDSWRRKVWPITSKGMAQKSVAKGSLPGAFCAKKWNIKEVIIGQCRTDFRSPTATFIFATTLLPPPALKKVPQSLFSLSLLFCLKKISPFSLFSLSCLSDQKATCCSIHPIAAGNLFSGSLVPCCAKQNTSGSTTCSFPQPKCTGLKGNKTLFKKRTYQKEPYKKGFSHRYFFNSHFKEFNTGYPLWVPKKTTEDLIGPFSYNNFMPFLNITFLPLSVLFFWKKCPFLC